jgi:hypothetical protein
VPSPPGPTLISFTLSGDKCVIASETRFNLISDSAAYKCPKNLKRKISKYLKME